MQRKVLTSEEMDGIYISTTRTLPLLNKLKQIQLYQKIQKQN